VGARLQKSTVFQKCVNVELRALEPAPPPAVNACVEARDPLATVCRVNLPTLTHTHTYTQTGRHTHLDSHYCLLLSLARARARALSLLCFFRFIT